VRAEAVVLAHGDHVALDALDLTLPVGATVAVIGPNGAGKSSLLDAVAGLLPLRSGRLEVFGAAPGADRRRVAYVLQSTEVPAHLPITVREVVALGRYARTGLWRPLGAAGRRAVDDAMDRVGMADLAGRQLLELSGGQRQRALVAQGLAAEADLLLLDEPMTGLDVVSRERITGVVAAERAAGRTVVWTTHDLDEARTADVVVLVAGRLVACGRPGEVLTVDHLATAYRGRVTAVAGGVLVDDPHHHGARSDRHDGHDHHH
jgi:manganese transport system ATP-binding protein